tara:strand:- start:660 stop:1493 length:834 start_codon:yes stop_codon:yes gene_type:complete
MNNLKMFCLTLEPTHKEFIKQLGYIPVGLGEKKFHNLNEWFTDKSGISIYKKNKNYGEYTFHYWLWKNYIDLKEVDDGWFGFCQYRKFWSIEKNNLFPKAIEELKPLVLNDIPESYKNFDVILGDLHFINQFKIMKFLKKGFKIIVKNPSYLLNKNKRNIKFHFDLMHGYNNLNKAIDLLDANNKKDFNDYVNFNISFNPHNMFICKSKRLLKEYYSNLFPWLERCEKIFGFKDLKGFGKIRIYTFLAERFMPYWFNKNAKVKTMPIVFYDIRKDIK